MELDNTDLRTGVNLVKKYSPVTGRLGAVWSPSDALSLYGQLGTGTDPLSGALSLPGGDPAAYKELAPVWNAIAAKVDAKTGVPLTVAKVVPSYSFDDALSPLTVNSFFPNCTVSVPVPVPAAFRALTVTEKDPT